MAKHSSLSHSAALRARLAVVSAITLGLLSTSAAKQATTEDSSINLLDAAASAVLPRKGLFNLGKVAVLPEAYLALLGPTLIGQAGANVQLPTSPSMDGVSLSWRLRTSNYSALSGDGATIPLQGVPVGTYDLEVTAQYGSNYVSGACFLTVTSADTGAIADSNSESEAVTAIMSSNTTLSSAQSGVSVAVAAVPSAQVSSGAAESTSSSDAPADSNVAAGPDSTASAAASSLSTVPQNATTVAVSAVVAAPEATTTAVSSNLPEAPKTTTTAAASSSQSAAKSSAQSATKHKVKSKPPSNARMAASMSVGRSGFSEYRIVSSNKPVIY